MGRKRIWLAMVFVVALFLAGYVAGQVLHDRLVATDGDEHEGGEDQPCPRSQGWWKNHPDAWTVDSLRLGAQEYSRTQLLEILGIATGGDASVILGRQLIAAKLNVEGGSDDSAAAESISRADHLLGGFAGSLPYGIPPTTYEGTAMVALAADLEDYNFGRLTPGCESPPPP